MAVQFKVRLTPSLMNIILGGWVVIFGGTTKIEMLNLKSVAQN